MHKYFYLTIILITINIYSQTTISGVIKNQDNEPLPYCSIGIKDSELGTISDENGNYEITIPESIDNEIIFSAIGYFDQIQNKNDLKANSNIILEYNSTILATAVINNNKMKEKIIGQKSKPMLTFSKMFDQNLPTIEQGNIFTIYQKTKLKSYNFHIIPSSKYEEITLKVNIYSVKNNLPGKVILDENIIYKTTTTGWQKIDLSQYGLVFNDLSQIAVTLQLVDYKTLENNDFVFGVSAKNSLSKNLLFRYQSQGNWTMNEGVFIANLEIAYLKTSGEKELNDNDLEESPEDNEKIKALTAYYQNKEKAAKTIYGKNKKGKYIDNGDSKIYYESYGQGEPLILLHGNNGDISDFYKQIPDLSKHYNVIAIDTRGQGKSTDLTDTDYTYEIFASDLFTVIQNLKLDKVNILGWSDGGNTALIFNSQYPELVNKLITIGANLNPSGVDENLLNDFKTQMSEQKGNLRLIKLMLNHPNISAAQLSQIKNPVLIIAGSNDVIKEEHTIHIHQLIDESKLEIIPNSTHYVPFEQPEKLNAAILNFLKE